MDEIQRLTKELALLREERSIINRAFNRLMVEMERPACFMCGGKFGHQTDCPITQIAFLDAKHASLLEDGSEAERVTKYFLSFGSWENREEFLYLNQDPVQSLIDSHAQLRESGKHAAEIDARAYERWRWLPRKIRNWLLGYV